MYAEHIKYIIDEYEGGYSNDRSDRGGETLYGISQTAYPYLIIQDLTLEQAVDIYHDDYWTPLRCHEMPDDIAFQLLNIGINMGVKAASRMIQRIVGTAQDGIIGPKTIQAIKHYRGDLKHELLEASVIHYSAICAINCTQVKYLRGWINRAFDSYSHAVYLSR